MNYVDLLTQENKDLEYLKKNIAEIADKIRECYETGGKVLVCGNGGSCADADHIVGELMKGFLLKRELSENEKKLFENTEDGDKIASSLQKGIKAVSLNCHDALNSAVLNDIDGEMIFAQQVYAYGEKNDLFIGISTGGNAKNVLNAIKVAKAKGLCVCGMTGNRGGKMDEYCDILINVPSAETYKIQEYHIKIYHAFCAEAERMIFGQ